MTRDEYLRAVREDLQSITADATFTLGSLESFEAAETGNGGDIARLHISLKMAAIEIARTASRLVDRAAPEDEE